MLFNLIVFLKYLTVVIDLILMITCAVGAYREKRNKEEILFIAIALIFFLNVVSILK